MIEQVLQKDYMINTAEAEEEQDQGHGQDTKVGHKVFLERRPDQAELQTKVCEYF